MLAAACSGGGRGDTSSTSGTSSPSAQEAEPKLSVAYSALTTKVGDTVTLSANLENAHDAVVWSVSGPGALSAASGNEVLYQATEEGTAGVVASAAGLTSAISIKVLPGPGSGSAANAGSGSAANAGSGSAANAGSGSADSGSAASGSGMTPTCSTIDVKGLILNVDGAPINGQGVFVLGHEDTLTNSGEDGHFLIKGVTPPYDLAMVENHYPYYPRVYVYRGLKRADPVLYVFTQRDQTLLPLRTTTLKGHLDGGDGGAIAGETRLVGFGSKAVRMPWNLDRQTGNSVTAIPGDYSLTVNWNGPETTTGTLVALEVRPDLITGAPADYWYASQPNVTLLSSQSLVEPPLTLMPVKGIANTQGTISLASGYVLTAKNLALRLEKDIFFPFYDDFVSLSQPNFSYNVPNIHNARSQVCAWATDTVPAYQGSWSGTCIDALKPQTDDAQLAILAAPQPSTPINDGNAVGLDTPFTWTAFEGGIHLVQIRPWDSINPSYFIFTEGTLTRIPDVHTLGLDLGAGPYEWRVFGFAPFASVDDFTASIPAPTLDSWVNVKSPTWIPPVPDASIGYGISSRFTVPSNP